MSWQMLNCFNARFFFSPWCELTKIMIVLLVITLSTWLCGDKRFADALIFYYSGKKKKRRHAKKIKTCRPEVKDWWKTLNANAISLQVFRLQQAMPTKCCIVVYFHKKLLGSPSLSGFTRRVGREWGNNIKTVRPRKFVFNKIIVRRDKKLFCKNNSK